VGISPPFPDFRRGDAGCQEPCRVGLGGKVPAIRALISSTAPGVSPPGVDRCRGGESDGGGRIATGITVGWEEQGRLAGRELEDVCRYALELLGAQRVSVWRQMLAADLISLYAVARADGKDEPAELRERWSYVPLSDLPVIAQSLRDGQPVEISDATTEAGRMPQFSADFGVRSLRCEPLLRGGESLGALTVEPAEVATGDLLAVRALVGAASASLGLLRADRRRAELELFLQLGEAAGSASIGQSLALGCEGLARLLDVRRASVFFVRDGHLVPRMSRMADGTTDSAAWKLFRSGPAMPLAEEVLASGGPVEANDATSPLLAGWWADTFGIAAVLGVPILNGGRVLGVLALDSERPRKFSGDHVRLAVGAATQLGWVIARADAHAALAHQATHDGLTGLLNRAALHDYLPHALARAARSGEELTVAFLDLDGFKEINDTKGHRRGDEVLAELARRLRTGQRKGDIVARLGGDEFAVLLHGSGLSGAKSAAARIAQLVTEPIDLGGETARVGVSIGVACFPAHAANDAKLLERADSAMYKAKRTHRQFELYEPDTDTQK